MIFDINLDKETLDIFEEQYDLPQRTKRGEFDVRIQTTLLWMKRDMSYCQSSAQTNSFPLRILFLPNRLMQL